MTKKNTMPEKKAGEPLLIAKKDFIINFNDYRKVIKKGDKLGDIPEKFMPNLKTEKVI